MRVYHAVSKNYFQLFSTARISLLLQAFDPASLIVLSLTLTLALSGCAPETSNETDNEPTVTNPAPIDPEEGSPQPIDTETDN